MKTLSLSLFAALLLSSPLFAVETAPTVTDAMAKAKEIKSDYLVFVYGGDWDGFGKSYKERVWAKPETLSLAQPNTIVTEYTYPEHPTEAEKEARKQLQKDFGQGTSSVPSLYFFDKNQFCYATLHGDKMDKNPLLLAKRIKEAQDLRNKRDEYLAQAEKLSGVEKAKLLGTAYDIQGLNRPKEAVDELKKCDPDDASGYQKRFTFDPWKYHSVFEKPLAEGLKELDAVVADPAYTAEQKQTILGIKSTYLRRNKADKNQIREVFVKMKSLDPNSVFGKAAEKGLELYAK